MNAAGMVPMAQSVLAVLRWWPSGSVMMADRSPIPREIVPAMMMSPATIHRVVGCSRWLLLWKRAAVNVVASMVAAPQKYRMGLAQDSTPVMAGVVFASQLVIIIVFVSMGDCWASAISKSRLCRFVGVSRSGGWVV